MCLDYEREEGEVTRSRGPALLSNKFTYQLKIKKEEKNRSLLRTFPGRQVPFCSSYLLMQEQRLGAYFFFLFFFRSLLLSHITSLVDQYGGLTH